MNRKETNLKGERIVMGKNKAEGFLLGTIVGAVIAGASALLFAPKSGKEMRDDITKQTNKSKGQFQEYADLAKEKGTELKETAQKASSDYMKNAKDTYSQVADSLNKGKDQHKDTLDQIKKEAMDTVNDGVQKGKDMNNQSNDTGVEGAKDRTMSFDYDEAKMAEDEAKGQRTENTSTEQTTEDGRQDKDTTNTNVGI
tara:strand:+ start:24 stop:617 length:594 start_codon:yes stop_codon:yes gene_type:complete